MVTSISDQAPYTRVIACSDTHCGHVGGLTPPEYWVPSGYPKLRKSQQAMWDWFDSKVDTISRPDVVIANGDLVDGRGERSEGRELLAGAGDPRVQIAIATRVMDRLNPRKGFVIAKGTPYHTGTGTDWEECIADALRGKGYEVEVRNHAFVTLGGVTFDCKHKIGGSSVPHGRGTALRRAKLWNELLAAKAKQPEARVVLRAHVHYHTYAGGPGWLALTLPSLQGDTMYGSRQCDGDVDFGFVEFACRNGQFEWQAHTTHIKPNIPKALEW
jgi:hypothetical protein